MNPQNQRFPGDFNQGVPSNSGQMPPMGQQPGPAIVYPQVPMPQPKNNNTLIIVLILVMVLFIGGLVWAFLTFNQGPSDTAANNSENAMSAGQDSAQAQGQNGTNQSGASGDLQADRATNFQAPGYWTLCGGSGSAGDLNLVYSASDVTSCPFSNNVRDAFVRQYLDTGNLNATVVVDSPVTLRSYTMQCRDDGTKVTCTGGNNAVVVIV